MTAPTRLVWELAGQPSPVASMAALLGDVETCRMCGGNDLPAAPVGKALGNDWTDHSCWRRPDSTNVCAACLWACSGKPPVTLRMWSIIAAPGSDLPPKHEKCAMPDGPGLTLLNRSNPAPISDILATPPDGEWLVTVAVSGQKHVLPYAHVNTGAGRWQMRMESTTVTSTPDEWMMVRGHALELRRLGVPASAVLTGDPSGIATADKLAAWVEHSRPLAPYLRSPLLDLALWTITKGTMQ
ncbi:hypothetical protein ACTQ0H_08430 [Collinsella sp. LCP21S3_A3]|uniref:hypothetical protein n=1 Tax=Collinsella sp. LCP21S3_A3 TaxID=3438769 RepID=UPI003F8FB110